MKKLTLLISALSFAAAAQEPGKFVQGSPSKPSSQTVDVGALESARQETRLAKLEALILREQIAVQQVEKIRADQQALYAETCKAAGIDSDPKVCMIDLEKRTVTRRPVDTPKK
jgi:hypothetical protein